MSPGAWTELRQLIEAKPGICGLHLPRDEGLAAAVYRSTGRPAGASRLGIAGEEERLKAMTPSWIKEIKCKEKEVHGTE